MKKLLLFAVLLASCLLTVPSAQAKEAPQQLINVENLLSHYEDSVLLIEKYTLEPTGERLNSKGCCVCVLAEKDKVHFVTAKHVVEKGFKLKVYIRGKVYSVIRWVELEDTDAAYFYITETNTGAKPLPVELSSSSEIVPATAIGMWAGTRKITGTFGHLNRKVMGPWVDQVYSYKTVYGLIRGTALIYPGFSGGAITDEYGRLLGINVLLGREHTTFVDIRYIWNSVSDLNKGKRIKLPLDNEFDVVGIPIMKRVGITSDDGLECGQLKGKVADLVTLLNQGGTKIAFLLDGDSKLIIKGETFKISRIEFESMNFSHNQTFMNKPIYKYVYFTGEGWALTIYLAETL